MRAEQVFIAKRWRRPRSGTIRRAHHCAGQAAEKCFNGPFSIRAPSTASRFWPAARFDQFVAGANAELVSQLSTLSDALMTGGAPERLFYLWGAAGSGRSHL